MKRLLKKLSKRIIIGILALVVIVVPLLYLNLLNSKTVSAAWFDDFWGYRQAVTITVTSSATDIKKLDTLVTVDTSTLITASKLQSSCQDLRFTSTNGQILPYYIDSGCNTSTTKVWVQIDLVPKSTTTYTMYMYYGNPSATAATDATKFRLYNGLVGYWTQNETSWNGTSGEVKDSSVNSNNGTAAGGATTTSSGKYSYAGNFDGINDYASIANYADTHDFNGAFTISFWTKPIALQASTDFISNWRIASIGGVSNHGMFIEQGTTAGNIRFVYRNNGTSVFEVTTDTAVLTAGSWNYVTASYDPTLSSANAKVYINGELRKSANATSTFSITGRDLLIATLDGGAGGYNRYLNGAMDDTRTYNRALSAEEITQLYNTPGAIASTATTIAKPTVAFASEEKSPGPIAYWAFDEGTGTTTQDSSQNNLDGTISGATWQTEDQCISSKCLSFDGTDDYVSTTDTNTLDLTGSFTLSTWVKRAATGVQHSIIEKYDWVSSSNNGGYLLRATSADKILFGPLTNDDTQIITSTSSISSGTWYHLATTFDGTTQKIYINGVLDKSGTTSVSAKASSATLKIGARGNDAGTTFNGKIDDVRIYNYARTADQIKADYNARGAAKGTSTSFGTGLNNNPEALNNGLVGYWKMNETSGNATDSSGNSMTLTNNNTVTYTAGKYGNAPDLNGTTQYFSIADNTTLSTGDIDFSVSAWVYIDTKHSTYSRPILAKWGVNGGGNEREYILHHNTANDRFEFGVSSNGLDSGATYATSNVLGSPSTGTWYFLVGWHDSVNNVVGISVNGGIAETSSHTAGARDGTGAFEIGRNDKGTLYFDGRIDEARVYKRVLSAAERTQLYNFATGPVGYWDFENGTSTTVYDTSTNSNTGTWSGSTTNRYGIGKYGKAGSFNGTNDYVGMGDPASGVLDFGTSSDFTISGWFKYSGTISTTSLLASKRDAAVATNAGYEVGLRSNGNLYARIADGSAEVLTADDGGSKADNSWHYFTVVFNRSGNVVRYIDSISYGTAATESTTATINNSIAFKVGTRTNGVSEANSPFNGAVDEVKLYNYARTQKQIVEDMNAGHPAVGSPVGSALGHWDFDEGYGTVANNKGNGGSTLNGTLTSISSPATSTSGWTQSGKYDKALLFDGTNDYVQLSSESSFDFERTQPLSISLWIKATTGASTQGVVTKLNPNSPFDGWGVVLLSTGKMNFSLVNDNTTNALKIETTGTFPLNEWKYFVVTYDGSSTPSGVKMYLDGAPVSMTTNTNSLSASILNNQTPTIGSYGATNRFFNGSLDEVKIYNYALTADEVKRDYNQGSAQVLGAAGNNSSYQKQAANQEYCVPGDTSSCAAPVGIWNFEEGSGSTVNDRSGNANTGTWSGTGSHWKPGKIGKAGNFNGSDDRVSLGTTGLSATAGTIEAWVNPSSTPTDADRIIVMGTKDSNRIYLLRVSTSGNFNIRLGTGSNVDTSTVLSTNTWSHVILTWSSGTYYAYVNGRQVATGSYSGLSSIGSCASIGSYDDCTSTRNAFFPGQIDQVKIFNYARSAAQIAWDYNKGAPIAHWDFDECQGSVVQDLSGNSNTGTINLSTTGTQTTAIGMGTCTSSASTPWYNGRNGKINSSLNFDGTDDYVEVADSATLEPGSGITVATWVKTTDTTCKYLAQKIQITTPYPGYALAINTAGSTCISANGTLAFWSGDNTNAWLSVALGVGKIGDNSWHLVVATNDGTTTRIYFDGIERTSGSRTLSTTNSVNLQIGRQPFTGQITYLTGQIDDTRIYNYALTADQIKILYTGGAFRVGPVTGAP